MRTDNETWSALVSGYLEYTPPDTFPYMEEEEEEEED